MKTREEMSKSETWDRNLEEIERKLKSWSSVLRNPKIRKEETL